MQYLVKSLLLLACALGNLLIKQAVLAQNCPMPHEIEVAVNERLYECYYMVPGTEWRSEYIPLKCMHYYHYTPDVFRERLKTLKFKNISSVGPGIRCVYVNAEGIIITLAHPYQVWEIPPELPRRICCCTLQ